jgi:uncharacterized membrane protein YoaK (UPF0700 family)
LWLGFVAGAVVGALVYRQNGAASLWAANGAALALAAASPKLLPLR